MPPEQNQEDRRLGANPPSNPAPRQPAEPPETKTVTVTNHGAAPRAFHDVNGRLHNLGPGESAKDVKVVAETYDSISANGDYAVQDGGGDVEKQEKKTEHPKNPTQDIGQSLIAQLEDRSMSYQVFLDHARGLLHHKFPEGPNPKRSEIIELLRDHKPGESTATQDPENAEHDVQPKASETAPPNPNANRGTGPAGAPNQTKGPAGAPQQAATGSDK